MKTIIIIAHVVSILMAVLALVAAIQGVIRTKQKMDRVFKFFLTAMIVLILATLIQINGFFGLVTQQYLELIFVVSRAIALLFVYLGVRKTLELVDQCQIRDN